MVRNEEKKEVEATKNGILFALNMIVDYRNELESCLEKRLNILDRVATEERIVGADDIYEMLSWAHDNYEKLLEDDGEPDEAEPTRQ
jgi:hypothetical protein